MSRTSGLTAADIGMDRCADLDWSRTAGEGLIVAYSPRVKGSSKERSNILILRSVANRFTNRG